MKLALTLLAGRDHSAVLGQQLPLGHFATPGPVEKMWTSGCELSWAVNLLQFLGFHQLRSETCVCVSRCHPSQQPSPSGTLTLWGWGEKWAVKHRELMG